MPNYVKNILMIDFNNADEAYKKNFFESIKDGDSDFSFNKIVPMPESLKIDASSRNELAIQAVTLRLMMTEHNGVWWQPYLPMEKDEYCKLGDKCAEEYSKIMERIPDNEADDFIELGLKCIKNKLLYGTADWYGWCIKNWGTKWDVCNCTKYTDTMKGRSYEVTVLDFDTAWSTPEPVIRKLSALFPEITFELLYADEDIGNNCGHLVFENGVSQEIEVRNATKFADSVWYKELYEFEEGL